MTGKQSTDINAIKNVCEQLLQRFRGCNFSAKNILQLHVTLELWHGVPQVRVYHIVPNFALILLRLHIVKSRAAQS